MWQLMGEIMATLDRCRTDFNLERPIDAILAKQRPPIKWDDLMKPPGMGSLGYCDPKATTFFEAPRAGLICQ